MGDFNRSRRAGTGNRLCAGGDHGPPPQAEEDTSGQDNAPKTLHLHRFGILFFRDCCFHAFGPPSRRLVAFGKIRMLDCATSVTRFHSGAGPHCRARTDYTRLYPICPTPPQTEFRPLAYVYPTRSGRRLAPGALSPGRHASPGLRCQSPQSRPGATSSTCPRRSPQPCRRAAATRPRLRKGGCARA